MQNEGRMSQRESRGMGMTAVRMTSSALLVLMSGAQVLVFDLYGGESRGHVVAKANRPPVSTCLNTSSHRENFLPERTEKVTLVALK